VPEPNPVSGSGTGLDSLSVQITRYLTLTDTGVAAEYVTTFELQPPPPERVVSIAAESRVSVVPPAPVPAVIPAEPRTLIATRTP
jgi:hypothetical protein